MSEKRNYILLYGTQSCIGLGNIEEGTSISVAENALKTANVDDANLYEYDETKVKSAEGPYKHLGWVSNPKNQ